MAAQNSDVVRLAMTNAGTNLKPGIWPRFELLISRDGLAFLGHADREKFYSIACVEYF
jgi:hypothetical protein